MKNLEIFWIICGLIHIGMVLCHEHPRSLIIRGFLMTNWYGKLNMVLGMLSTSLLLGPFGLLMLLSSHDT